MLVLTRKEGETILIGDDIKIVISRMCGDGRVRIGIEAPKSMPILRGELKDKQDAEGKEPNEDAA